MYVLGKNYSDRLFISSLYIPQFAAGGQQKRLVNQGPESQQSNFADFSKFPTIPSQEVLNIVPDGHPVNTSNAMTTEGHRRSMSLDYHNFVSTFFNVVFIVKNHQWVFNPHES